MKQERILIVLMGSIGDVARGISVAAHIKKHSPDSYIGWLIEPKCSAIVKKCTAIDEIITFERGSGLSALVKLYKQLKHFKADVTLDLQRHAKSGFFSFLSGAPRRIGFAKANTKEGNWIFQTEYVDPVSDNRSKLEVYLSFLPKLGIPIPVHVEFALKAPDLGKFSDKIQTLPKPILGIVIGSTWPSKDWPTVGYIDLFNKINQSKISSIVLIGDATQRNLAKNIVTTNFSNYLNLVGETSLTELISILPNLDLLVGPDSGPGHIAAALGVRQVTLFGPTSPERVSPYGSKELAVNASMPCSPCLRKRCPGLDNICMRLISPNAVYDRIKGILG